MRESAGTTCHTYHHTQPTHKYCMHTTPHTKHIPTHVTQHSTCKPHTTHICHATHIILHTHHTHPTHPYHTCTTHAYMHEQMQQVQRKRRFRSARERGRERWEVNRKSRLPCASPALFWCLSVSLSLVLHTHNHKPPETGRRGQSKRGWRLSSSPTLALPSSRLLALRGCSATWGALPSPLFSCGSYSPSAPH